jgi:HEAT repeat protein
MKNTWKLLLLAAFTLSLALTARAGAKSETEYLADLGSSKEKDVLVALQGIEKNYPTSAPAQAKIKTLLADNRIAVKRKAARVIGIIGADVSSTDLDNISTLLAGSDKATITDGLKSLRGLKAQSTVPKIVPLLQNPDKNIKRDACRTLAVLGDKSVIPSIQPLTADSDPKVAGDAADAIAQIKAR